VLVVHIAALTASTKSKRRGNAGQNRCWKRSAQFLEKTGLVNGRQQFRHEIGNDAKPTVNSLHAAAKPPDRARQCYLGPTDQICGGLHAAG